MKLDKKFPEEYIELIRSLDITPDYRVVRNSFYGEEDRQSQFFTPVNEIGELSYRVLRSIQAEEVKTFAGGMVENSLGDLIENTDILKVHPNLKIYFQLVLLEAMSLEIAIEHDIGMREYLYEKDIENIRENIMYITDIVSVDPRYTDIILHLQELYVDLGYIQAQIPVIKRDMEEALDG